MMTLKEICFSDEGDWGLNEGRLFDDVFKFLFFFLSFFQVVFLSFSYGLDVQRNWNY